LAFWSFVEIGAGKAELFFWAQMTFRPTVKSITFSNLKNAPVGLCSPIAHSTARAVLFIIRPETLIVKKNTRNKDREVKKEVK